jgi:hypothetical protein
MKARYLSLLGRKLERHISSCVVVAVLEGTGVIKAVQILDADTR